MPVTMGQMITASRSQIDETNNSALFYQDTELRTWINDSVRDIARRAEVLLIYNTSINAIVGVAKYNLPTDLIRVHRIEYVPSGSTQVYPVNASTYDEMDQIWGINPTTQAAYPSTFACWGTPGAMTVQFYPVPAQSGQFNIFYYQMPIDLATDGIDDGETLTIPEGWSDLVVYCVSYRAYLKARDPNWQLFKQLYNENLQYLVDVTRQAHDSGRFIQTQTGAVPQWLYAFSDE